MADINKYVEEFFKSKNIFLLDVRTNIEYKSGHIKGSLNIPVDIIKNFKFPFNKNSKIYVYCRSGSRSQIAVDTLLELGFTDVINIGGILDFKGDLEK